jgi:hypothetical protein
MKPKIILVILLVLINLTMTTPIFATDILHRLTHNDQYALVLGKVTKVTQSSFEISVAKIISGHRVPARITIKPAETGQPQLGEKLLISLARGNRNYKIRWGLFRVSNLDSKQLKIINSTWPQGDLAALEHYLHTNGTEHDFFFVFSSAFVRYSDGTFTRIYPELIAQQRSKHFKLMICPEREDYHLTDSTAPGLGLTAIYYRQSEDLQFCWETNYGEFNLWNSPDSRVIPLGTTATIEQWQTVYWTPSLTQKAISKEGIKITLIVKSLKSKANYEQASIEIQPKEEAFTVKW